MSKTSFSDLTSIPVTSSSGQSRINYEQLFALFNKPASEAESDSWGPYVEQALREPQLDGVTFEINCQEEPGIEWRWDALWSSQDQPSWEALAKVLILCLQEATKCWLHPKSLTGFPVLMEHHSGTVNRVVGDSVAVCFGKGEDQFEAGYALSHFKNPEMVSRGDRIEAVIGLWHQKHQSHGIDRFLTAEQQQELDAAWNSEENLVRGDLEL